ncbi:MAG: M14 family metallopeptidase [Bacteroidota bacterium]
MIIFFLILATGAGLFAQDGTITVPLRFDRYYNYSDLVIAMKALNKAYPSMTRLVLVGKSEEGRDIYSLEINNPATGSDSDKPGVYVDGNIHGNEIQAGEVCLYLANMLLTNYATNEKIKKVVDRTAFYIIPSVNVDGRFHFFNDPNNPNSSRSIRCAMDDDRDGLFDEDFPDDLDSDGNICMMRKKDPNGNYKTDPEDPRLMVRIKPGEKGEWTLLGQEGIDNDGDGKVNEDAEGYLDPNRNWPYHWEPNYVQSGAGYYPFSGVGLKAIGSYVLNHPNIIMVWAFHNNGGMYLRGPSTKEEGEFPREDIAVYDYLGQNSEKITPGYQYLVSWKDLYSTYGDFDNFTNNLLGTYSFVGELYQTETESYSVPDKKKDVPETSDNRRMREESDRERIEFNDHVAMGELYKPWKSYTHPVYGEIEIGGWVKMSSRLPHPFMLTDLVHRNASAVLFSAEQTPEVSMEILSNEKVGNDLRQIRIRLTNAHAMPSMSYMAVKNRIYPMDMLQLTGKNAKVVAGGELKNIYTGEVKYKEYRPELQFTQVPGFGKVEFQFLVEGKGEIEIAYSSQKAGKIRKTLKL